MLDIRATSAEAVFSMNSVIDVNASNAQVVEPLLNAGKTATRAAVMSGGKTVRFFGSFHILVLPKTLYYLICLLY